MRNYEEYENGNEEYEKLKYEFNAARIQIEINGEEMNAIVDSGAGSSVITEEIRKKLQIGKLKSSTKKFIIANGIKVASKGKIEIKIDFGEIEIPIEFEVIDSTEEDIILGTSWMHRKIYMDYIKDEVTIYYEGNEIVKPMYYYRIKENKEKDNEEEELNN